MDASSIPDHLSATIGTIGGSGAMGAVLLWQFKRWVSQVETKLDTLNQTIAQLQTSKAVADERQAHLMGGMELLRGSVDSTSRMVGAMTGSVQKLWLVLQAKGVVEAQHSDQVLK